LIKRACIRSNILVLYLYLLGKVLITGAENDNVNFV